MKKMGKKGMDMMTDGEMKKMMSKMKMDGGFYGHHTVKSVSKRIKR